MKRRTDAALNRIFVAAVLMTASTLVLGCNASRADDDVAEGKLIFEKQNCEGCHQNGGNLLSPDHPIKGQKFQDAYKDDVTLEKAIRKGFPNVGMPPSPKHAINDKDMKQLIAYIRSLSAKPAKK